MMLTSVFVAAPARATDQGGLPDSLAINFQPANKEVPTGFQPDAGQPYAAQRGYGWILTDGNDRQCVDRHFAANQELDTYCHATSYYWDVDGFWTPHDSPATWRADLQPGTYDVTVVVGDPMKRTPGIAHSVQVEGVTFFDREPTSDSMTWARITKRVTVEDSSLDVSFAGGDLTKIVSITAQRVGATTTTTQASTTTQAPTTTQPNRAMSLSVNFQPSGAAVPPGFVADSGAAFSAETGFGWVLPDGSRRQCGDRNAVADQRIDTFCHATTRYLNQGGRWVSVDSPAAWKALVANGQYDVTVTVGESRYQYSSIAHSAQVEGVSFHDRVLTTQASPTASATHRVTVADGSLDLTFDGGTKTKVVSVTIVAV
ncbi:MAG: hypothetical protein KDB16_09500, partial [Acidimicrobiales bacterium]|nr:hypothetical protein [Acidimicrobiales bacterium]